MTELTWRKSSRSDADGNCVEAAAAPGGIAVRDSKAPHNPHLSLPAAAWTGLLEAIRAGRLALRHPGHASEDA